MVPEWDHENEYYSFNININSKIIAEENFERDTITVKTVKYCWCDAKL